MPNASVSMAIKLKPGCFNSIRMPKRKSRNIYSYDECSRGEVSRGGRSEPAGLSTGLSIGYSGTILMAIHRSLGCGFILLFSFLARAQSPAARVEGKEIRIEFDRDLHSRVIAKFDGTEIAIGGTSASEFITIASR